MDKINATKNTYGFLWGKQGRGNPPDVWHFDAMQEVIKEPIVTGTIGLDAGSGCGYDTYIMAKRNPLATIVSLDISDGIYRTKELTRAFNNVRAIKGSVSEIPIKDGVFDFAYSFGVLHHTPDPKKGLSEMSRVLKNGGPVFLYLYEDHSGNPIKYIGVRIISAARLITVRIPSRVLYGLCRLLSPVVFIVFSLPSKIFRRFKLTGNIAEKMPFNFGKRPFSLSADLYDRFHAPIEHRYKKEDLYSMFSECGFYNTTVTRLKNTAGWVVWGYKK